jgi:hypothetical protein
VLTKETLAGATDTMDIDQVLPQLCVGQSPKTVEDLDMLNHEYGITAVLCLQTDGEIGKATLGWDRMEAYYRIRAWTFDGCRCRAIPILFVQSLPNALRFWTDSYGAGTRSTSTVTSG